MDFIKQLNQYVATFLVVISVLLSAKYANAESVEKTFTPARFTHDKNSLAQILDFPKGAKEGTYHHAVYCWVYVLGNGYAQSPRCRSLTKSTDGQSDFSRKTEKYTEKAIFRPATVNGKPITVLMPFTALFVCKDDTCETLLIPNHGINKGKYGLSYIAPQRVGSETIFEEIYKRYINYYYDVPARHYHKLAYSISANISTSGKLQDFRIVHVHDKLLTGGLERVYKHFEYIPGFYKGKPDEMQFYHETYFRENIHHLIIR